VNQLIFLSLRVREASFISP